MFKCWYLEYIIDFKYNYYLKNIDLWYPATVTNVINSSGEIYYNVIYYDDEEEFNILSTRILPLDLELVNQLDVGTTVLANYKGIGILYPGKITKKHGFLCYFI